MQGDVFIDIEVSLKTDSQKIPAQLLMTVSKVIQKSPDADVKVGDKINCIYLVVSSSSLKMECGEVMPPAFTSEAQIYAKQ